MPDLHALDENVRELAYRMGVDMRRVEAKTLAWVTPQMFGDVGKGGDDSLVFQSAIDALPDTGGRIIVPPGVYLVHDLVIGKPVVFDCQAGCGQVTTLASGGQTTTVAFKYNGPGGPGSRMFVIKAPVAGQWMKGGGFLGRPHISGEHKCEYLIVASSMHGGVFDIEMSRATRGGMVLNAGNGVLSQFNVIDFKYVWGSQPAAEPSHGLVMSGNLTGPTGWAGCTQNRVWSEGATKNGDMIAMVGHCDNNHIWAHGTQGAGANKGTGRTISMTVGNDDKSPHVNHIHYMCGSAFLQAGTYGNHFDFLTSEGQTITGGGQFTHGPWIDYITGKTFAAKMAPITVYDFVAATQMQTTGAAVRALVGGTPVTNLPESGIGGVAFLMHDENWGAGTVVALEFVYRGNGTAANVLLDIEVTTSVEGQGLTSDLVTTEVISMPANTSINKHTRALALAIPAKGYVSAMVARRPAGALDTATGAFELLGCNLRIDFAGPASLEAPAPSWKEQKT